MNVAALVDAARRLPRTALLGAIRFYKRFLSPHKGYSCAYRVHTGRGSCSTLGCRAVARYGVFRGLGVLGLRLDQCRLKHERHGGRPRPALRRQGGFIECDGCCDASCADGLSCDALGCDALGCAPSLEDIDCCGAGDFFDGCDNGPCGRSRRSATPVRERGRRRRGTPGGPSDAMPGVPPESGSDDSVSVVPRADAA